jgi:hypothetical protein
MCSPFRCTAKLVLIFVAVAFLLSIGLSRALAAEKLQTMPDKKAEKTVVQGSDKMMEGKKMLIGGLGKQKLQKDPKLESGIKMLSEGEKMVLDGRKLMKKKDGKAKGKETMMSGSTKMMEGKDAIMNELKARGMMQEGKLQEGEKMIKQGEETMLEGKNGMMDGFKNWE